MKNYLLIIATSFAITQGVYSQTKERPKNRTDLISVEPETIISINFIPTLKTCSDTDTSGHKLGDVMVEKSLTPKTSVNYSKKDTNISYQIHFYKKYKNTLRDYSMDYEGAEKYDKASYSWLNDTTVVVILMNSTTKERTKLKLFQTFCDKCSPGIDTDFKKEK